MSCSIDNKLKEIAKVNFNTHPNRKDYDNTLFDLQSFIAHKLDNEPYMKILDAGCAYGTLSDYLAEKHHVTALDALPELIDKDSFESKNIEFISCNLETDDIGYEDKFDLVIFTEVIEHLNYNPVPVIEKLYKALKPGGKIICTTPMKELQGIVHPNKGRYANYAHYRDIPLPWNGYTFIDDHHYFYSKPELSQLFHEVGFNVLERYPIREGTTHYLLAHKK